MLRDLKPYESQSRLTPDWYPDPCSSSDVKQSPDKNLAFVSVRRRLTRFLKAAALRLAPGIGDGGGTGVS